MEQELRKHGFHVAAARAGWRCGPDRVSAVAPQTV